MTDSLLLTALAAAGLAAAYPRLRQRLELSLAKHPSLTGHSRLAKRVAALVPGYAYDEARFFNADDTAPAVQARRRGGFARLAATLNGRHSESIALTKQARERISDLQFTAAYRVPFQFSPYLREHIGLGGFVQRSDGVTVTDLDGRMFFDLTGSYGVNVFGNDFYKHCISEGAARVADLGPVLGSLHPVVASNAQALCTLSGMDEVSFHMSGTEAVMQAVRLARYHTRRKYLVRFSGRLPRLVGRRATRPRQPAAAGPHLHPEGDGRRQPACAAQAARHCLRAGQPAAGPAPQQGRAQRRHTRGQQPQRGLRPRRLHRLAAAVAAGVHRTWHRADL
jgi:glutamate-1-semialdehyde 2,1-aminomutase